MASPRPLFSMQIHCCGFRQLGMWWVRGAELFECQARVVHTHTQMHMHMLLHCYFRFVTSYKLYAFVCAYKFLHCGLYMPALSSSYKFHAFTRCVCQTHLQKRSFVDALTSLDNLHTCTLTSNSYDNAGASVCVQTHATQHVACICMCIDAHVLSCEF